MRRCGLILACTFALAQPAWAQLFGNSAELTRQIQAQQQRVDALDARIGRLESAMQNNEPFLGLLKEVETLKAEIAKLRGQAEVQVHQMDTLGKRQNDLYVDLDQRVTDLAKSPKPASAAGGGSPEVAPSQPAPAAVVASPPGPVAAPSAPRLDPMMESRSYEASLDHFRGANYAGAIAGFKGFLQAHPDSTLASNAQYWIGYSYFALKDYKSALAHQQKLVAVYPTSAKVPDALLNIASSMIELDDLSGARKVLEALVAKYPGTPAANLATRRLSALK